MLSSSAVGCRSHSPVKSVVGFLFLLAFGIGLMGVKTKGLETVKTPEVVKTPVASKQADVLSAADALQWRQEFLWRRTIAKLCPNSWIDEQRCARPAERL
jgi:hypothetical protein